MQAIQNAWLRSRAFGYVGDTKCRNGKETSFLATRLVLNAGKSRIKALGETFRAQNNARENIVREKHPWRKTLLDTIFSMLSVLPGSVPTKKRVCRHRNVSPPKSVPNGRCLTGMFSDRKVSSARKCPDREVFDRDVFKYAPNIAALNRHTPKNRRKPEMTIDITSRLHVHPKLSL